MEINYFKKYFEEPKGGFFDEIYNFDPDDIEILIIKRNGDNIGIKFGFIGSKGVWETEKGNTKPTHFDLKITFIGEIICSKITKSDNIENIKEINNLILKITKPMFSNIKKVTLSYKNNSEDKIIIKCKRIFFKDNHFNEFTTDKNGNLIPYKDE